MSADACPATQAGLAFDALAENYDAQFTRSSIGRAQRDAVWRKAVEVFRGKLSILELNCGTGEDALFFAGQGHRITALDASRAMIDRAARRKEDEAPDAAVDFRLLPTEDLGALPSTHFDGVFSNFSGLNCVDDLAEVAMQLAHRTQTGAPALLCFSTRFCLWESAWHLLCGKWRKAVRRWSGHSTAVLNGVNVSVHYPTIGDIAIAFSPHFTLRSASGIGIFVPPSYLESWMQRFPRALSTLAAADRIACHLPVLRTLGDHVLLHFVRIGEDVS
ncbi:MAG TPA: class I SAM-dependent methyltransferase [Acidobacteriaceae bacterium]